MWLVRRVIVLGLLLVVLSASVIVLVRQSRSPTPLKALGFDVCDGELCWRGLMPGMPRETALSIFPALDNRYPMAVDDAGIIAVQTTSIIETISIEANDRSHGLPITLGEIVAHYGPPCRVWAREFLQLVYPKLRVSFDFDFQVPPEDTWVALSWSPDLISLHTDETFTSGGCQYPPEPFVGIWQGFTSVYIYRTRFERAASMTGTP